MPPDDESDPDGGVMARRKRDQATAPLTLLGSRLSATGQPLLPEALARGLAQRSDPSSDVWASLRDSLDPSDLCPKLADDIEIRIFRLRWGNDYAMIANPRALLHYQLEVWEAQLAEQLDGSKTLAELVVARLEEGGDLDANAVTDLVLFLQSAGFLIHQPMDVTTVLAAAVHPPSRGERLKEIAKTLRLDWREADGHVRWWYKKALWALFKPVGFALSAVFAVGGFIAFLVAISSRDYTLSQTDAALDSLILIGLSFVLTYAHELGHALALVHYGRRIKSAGFMLYFGSPAFFVDASDGLMLDRGPRIVESATGPYAEMILAGIGSFMLLLFPDAGFAPLLFKFSLLNYFVIFENLIPLLELDGYFILAETIEVPDLRERSLQFIQHDVWHKLRARERFSKQEVGLGLYAVIGVAFTIFSVWVAIFFWQQIFGNLVTALWAGGLGSRLILLLLALLLIGPVIRGLIALGRTVGRRVHSLWRRAKFKIETSWRVEAAQMIDALPAFDELPADTLSDLAGRVRLVSFRPGAAVFRQGDRPVAFYVVRRGTVRVEEEDPDSGDVSVLRVLTRGDSFGELGLLQSAPRAATVRANDDVELFEVDEATFDRLLSTTLHAPEFALTLQTMAEIRELSAFSTLGTEGVGELLAHGAWITAAPGQPIVEQGGVGDAFFAIRSGQVDVLRDGIRLKTLGAGDHFGEIALLRDVPRTASVVARTPIRAFRLDREGFDLLVRDAFQRGVLKEPTDKTWQH